MALFCTPCFCNWDSLVSSKQSWCRLWGLQIVRNRFFSIPDVVDVSDKVKPNLCSRSFASMIFSIALVEDCWKLGFTRVTRTTFSVPHSSSCWEQSGVRPTRSLNSLWYRVVLEWCYYQFLHKRVSMILLDLIAIAKTFENNKTPGEYGLTVKFYKTFWNFVGNLMGIKKKIIKKL